MTASLKEDSAYQARKAMRRAEREKQNAIADKEREARHAVLQAGNEAINSKMNSILESFKARVAAREASLRETI